MENKKINPIFRRNELHLFFLVDREMKLDLHTHRKQRFAYTDAKDKDVEEDPKSCTYEPQKKRQGTRNHLREELNKTGALMDVVGGVDIMDTVTQNEREMPFLTEKIKGEPFSDVFLLVWSYIATLKCLYEKVLPKGILLKGLNIK